MLTLFLMLVAAVLGGWLSLFLAGYILLNFDPGLKRVLIMIALIIGNLAVVILSWFLLPNITPFLLSFSFTLLGMWSIMNLRNVVYSRVIYE